MVATLQEQQFLTIDAPVGGDDLAVLSLDGEDMLCRCFRYQVEIATTRGEDAVAALLGRPLTLWIADHDTTRRRPLHAHIRRVTGTGRTTRTGRHYRLELAPRLWFLSCSVDCRVFQNQSIPSILQSLFQDEGLNDFEFRITQADYPALDYCVQYRETSLDFACRLMEQVGLFFWHEHAKGKHLLVIADSNFASRRTDPATLTVAPDDAGGALRSLEIDCTFRPGVWTLNDYDFTSPTKALLVNTRTLASMPQMLAHEVYDYPGHFQSADDGRRLTRMRVEMEEAQHTRVVGSGTCAGFDPGRRFVVAGSGASYLLTEVRHHATSVPPEAGEGVSTYSNDYVAIPAAAQFRPACTTPRPVISGTQTATIVGPAGQNIHCDEYGRVRVQFHWDRRGQRNEGSSCWVRVAQARSGSYYGTLAIPHVGHEVLVAFIEGDPDRPIIVGTVPNALTMPPIVLPGDKNKTVQRDHGDNKIVMQGAVGKEYLSLVSPRAVNMLASGRSARPLSASAPDGGSHLFWSDPAVYDLTQPASTVPVPGSTPSQTPMIVPDFMDPIGLNELWLGWYGTTQSDVDNSDPVGTSGSATTAGTAGSYGVQDGKVADSYLNWGSAGKINCLTFDNNNNWVGGDANTWVSGNVNTQINGNSTTTIGGHDYGADNALAVSKTTIWGTSNTIIYGANVASTLGDSTTTVLGANESFVFGMNTSVDLGWKVAVQIAGETNINPLEVKDTTGVRLKTAEAEIQTLLSEVKMAGDSIAMIELALFV